MRVLSAREKRKGVRLEAPPAAESAPDVKRRRTGPQAHPPAEDFKEALVKDDLHAILEQTPSKTQTLGALLKFAAEPGQITPEHLVRAIRPRPASRAGARMPCLARCCASRTHRSGPTLSRTMGSNQTKPLHKMEKGQCTTVPRGCQSVNPLSYVLTDVALDQRIVTKLRF